MRPKHILVTGVRHRTAPIAVRERFALREDQIQAALAALKAQPGIDECAILSTCNRTEFYIATADTATGVAAIRQFFRQHQGLNYDEHRPHLFTLIDEDAALHLFRVASGLDSLILGEGQILGQVKDALGCAQEAGTHGTLIDKLFKTALTAGKRVRTETGIAEKDASVSRAAFDFAKAYDANLFNRQIALVGGGKMAEILMASLKSEMTTEQIKKNIRIVNRSERRLETLAAKHGLTPEPWEKLDTVIAECDVLFVATGAPHVIFGRKHFEDRGEKLVIDIAVPRNVDPRVGELRNVKLFNTDNLSGASVAMSAETQTLLQEQAQRIIEDEYAGFYQWLMTLSIVPTITQLHAHFEQKANGDEQSMALIKKILHEPTVRLRNESNPEALKRHAETLTHLFDLDVH